MQLKVFYQYVNCVEGDVPLIQEKVNNWMQEMKRGGNFGIFEHDESLVRVGDGVVVHRVSIWYTFNPK